MQRRQFLTAAGTGSLGALGGCTARDLAGGSDRHPFAGSTLTVRVEDQGSTAHDVGAITRETLDFWAVESSQYTGFEIDFEIVEADDPDIVMAYVDTPEQCSGVENYSSDVLGCAPQLRAGTRVPQPVTAVVVAADRPVGSIRTTAQHEIGHVLGLGHEDAPPEIMSNRPEDRIPRYQLRVDIWETALAAHDRTVTAAQQLNSAISSWNDEGYEDAARAFEAAETAFEAAHERFQTARDRTADLESEPPLETVALASLRDDLDRRIERMSIGAAVAGTMTEASTAAADGDQSAARELSAEANDRFAEFHAIGSEPIRNVAVALGLVRGYNREQSGVAVEDEEL